MWIFLLKVLQKCFKYLERNGRMRIYQLTWLIINHFVFLWLIIIKDFSSGKLNKHCHKCCLTQVHKTCVKCQRFLNDPDCHAQPTISFLHLHNLPENILFELFFWNRYPISPMKFWTWPLHGNTLQSNCTTTGYLMLSQTYLPRVCEQSSNRNGTNATRQL